VDAVVSNPPYSQNWDPANKESDPRYARFGLAPKSKADFAFLLHDLFHLKPDGIMTIVLPHGVLFRGGEEGTIRKKLIEANHIDAIIGLPAGIFFGTGIPTVVIVIKQKRANTDILVIDASKGFLKEGKNNKLRASDIKRISDAVRDRQATPKFAKVVDRDTIRENDYNLNIPRYVDSSENTESWDIYAAMFGGIPVNEIAELEVYWKAFPNLKETLFTVTSAVNAVLKVEDINKAITEHTSVKTFVENFTTSFSDLAIFLKEELLSNIITVHVSREQEVLGNDIFKRLETIPLIDKYQAYQLLDNQWEAIKVDLEIIQTEGFDAAKVVDPKMVLKKKDGKETEVQDGWIGRIMPFQLVQETYLKEELENLQQKENRLLEITATFEEILESLTEEEKEEDTINDAKDSFVNAEVIKEAKQIRADNKKNKTVKVDKDSYEAKILEVDKMIAAEKELKKELKIEFAALQHNTKTTIEALTDDQVYELLELKWIHPVVASYNSLPTTVIDELTTKTQTLADKYSTTYSDVANEINQAENSLAELIGDLDGDEFDMKGLNKFKVLLHG
jgi:type I restriction enzyme M protein